VHTLRSKKLKHLSGIFILIFVLLLISCDSFESKFTDKGIQHLALEEYKLAIDDFSAALKENPDFNDAYFLRAYAYYESAESMEEVNLATKDFSAYIENDQGAGLKEIKDLNIGISLDRAYIGRAITYHQNCEAFSDIKNCQRAVDDLVIASRIAPNSWQVYQTLGIVYETYAHKGSPVDKEKRNGMSIQAYNKAGKLR
jgi:tetratricopeptide (TPR) repeat protein